MEAGDIVFLGDTPTRRADLATPDRLSEWKEKCVATLRQLVAEERLETDRNLYNAALLDHIDKLTESAAHDHAVLVRTRELWAASRAHITTHTATITTLRGVLAQIAALPRSVEMADGRMIEGVIDADEVHALLAEVPHD